MVDKWSRRNQLYAKKAKSRRYFFELKFKENSLYRTRGKIFLTGLLKFGECYVGNATQEKLKWILNK